jgi:hypothetical protein
LSEPLALLKDWGAIWASAIILGLLASFVIPSPFSEHRRWYRRWIGGHWEMTRAGSIGEYEYWDHVRACRKDDPRDPWQKGGRTCEEWPIMNRWLSILSIGRTYQYASYVLRHKWHVLRAGWRCADTWRELWLCLLHDSTKFHPIMWIPYANHFYNADGSKRTRIAADGFSIDEKDDRAFDRAWLWHIQRSKHHPQHWVEVNWCPCGHRHEILLEDSGKAKCLRHACGWEGRYSEIGDGYLVGSVQVIIREMPVPYVTEMICDWMGAGLAQGNGDTLGWYKARGHRLPMGPRTRALVESRLGYVAPEVAA